MPGPAPKDPSTRARRNKTTTRATLTPHTHAAPEMPERADGWHAMTARWWADVWASPMSQQWDESDVHNVSLLALVYDDIWTAETPRDRKEAAAEFRQQRKDLGLTPLDRRRLEWSIEQADEAKDRGRQRRARQTPQPPAGDDPRNALRAV